MNAPESTSGVIIYLALGTMVAMAVVTDLWRQRIPNGLTVTGMLIGLALQAWHWGLEGLTSALGGLGVGLMAFLPLYIRGGMGAGDTKLMAAVGTFLGAKLTLIAVASTLIAGGVLGLSYVIGRKGVWSKLRQSGNAMRALPVMGAAALGHASPSPSEAPPERFPYAVAIALGTVSAVTWHGF